MHAIKAQRAETYSSTHSYPQHYMQLGGQLRSSAILPPGKKPRYPLNKRQLGGSQSWSKHFWNREKYLASAGNQTVIPQLSGPYLIHYSNCDIPAHQH
jgi:hypothetical protein